ncbi:mobilome CxxCx(11)CxxC protein [Burkholderia ambifaria]|uniref:mobilome CxxCx(11)CxxC protein n=1 Tax=Burkholderia ambifaria TaxID=152480 RepID=UPI0015888C77|nr:mobilome CxxCx(11)CxxC protein [Burkholderia ambifaria]
MSTPQATSHPTEIELSACFQKEFHAFGTAWHFEQRALRFGKLIKTLTWFTFALPIAFGTLVLTFDDPTIGSYARIASGVLGGVAFLWALWALVANWSDAMGAAQRSMIENNRLHEAWKDAKHLKDDAFVAEYNKLQARDISQVAADMLAGVKEKEKRRMMRKTLMHYALPCKTCNVKPVSIKSSFFSKCETCGKC